MENQKIRIFNKISFCYYIYYNIYNNKDTILRELRNP